MLLAEGKGKNIIFQSDSASSISQEQKKSPLAGKKFGVEFNFIRLLYFGSDIDWLDGALTGGFSLFDINRRMEIAFPVFYREMDGKMPQQITIGCHGRLFMASVQNGLYFSGFIRYAHIHGKYSDWKAEEIGHTIGTENKLGLGVGLGYRSFSPTGLYWGISLNRGRYILGENDIFKSKPIFYDNDSEIIYMFELLKLGIAF